MKAFRLVDAPDGTTQEVEAEEASPGDLILYRATFTNAGEADLAGLQPQIPVPAGFEYVAGSVTPAPEAVAIAGQGFVAFPVQAADGTSPSPEAYRAFRWQVSVLKAGATFQAELKVRVPAE